MITWPLLAASLIVPAKAEFIAMFSKDFDNDTQKPTGENEVKEQNQSYKGDDEIDR